MTSDEQALMSAILADPADDTPRLQLADWLEEQGDADRAEFIRDCVWMHANHTDCPVRLSDLGRGRPVPLRCGVCEYCTCRRRAEKFYAKHPWVEAPSYAVAFEPTPIDGAMPTCPGLMLVIQRGFVAEVHTTLEAWMGGTCDCGDGERWGQVMLSRGSPNILPIYGGGYVTCDRCNGTGTIPGHGPAIVSRHPVERVVVTNKCPMLLDMDGDYYHRWYTETKGLRDRDIHELPHELFPLMPHGKDSDVPRWLEPPWFWQTEQAARDSLSVAAIAWAKQQSQQ